MVNNLEEQVFAIVAISETDNFKCLVVSDGQEKYDNAYFAPGISREALNKVRNSTLPYFTLAYNILVIISTDRVVLIDAGNGDRVMPDAGHLPANLQAAGISPEQVTDIVISHAHPDHINGLLDNKSRPVFSNATIHIAKTEYDYWKSERVSELQRNVADKLEFFKECINIFESNVPLFDFLLPIAAPGHTPGHQMFKVTTPKGSFTHMADICHDDVVLFRKPGWGMTFDADFKLAVKTRIAALSSFADSNESVFGYHMPWPGFGRVIREGEAFAWKQKEA